MYRLRLSAASSALIALSALAALVDRDVMLSSGRLFAALAAELREVDDGVRRKLTLSSLASCSA